MNHFADAAEYLCNGYAEFCVVCKLKIDGNEFAEACAEGFAVNVFIDG